LGLSASPSIPHARFEIDVRVAAGFIPAQSDKCPNILGGDKPRRYKEKIIFRPVGVAEIYTDPHGI